MLTYATIYDFRQMKEVDKSGVSGGYISQTLFDNKDDKMLAYLARASRFIQRFTRRDFYPRVETRSFGIPYRYLDLRLYRNRTGNLVLDKDLLEVSQVYDGEKTLTTDEYFLLDANIYPKTEIAIQFPRYWGGDAYRTSHIEKPEITITGIWGYHDQYAYDAWLDTYEVIQAGGIDSNITTLTLSDVDGLDEFGLPRLLEGYLIRVNTEFMEVVSVDSDANTVQVRRGVRGTSAITHAENSAIHRWRVIEDIVEATLQIAKTWRESGVAAGGRLGTSDLAATVEINIPNDPLMVVKMYQRKMSGTYQWGG